MDILSQYDRQRSQQSYEKPITYSEFPVEAEKAGTVTKILLKLSGGKVQSGMQINIILGVIAIIFFSVACVVVYNAFFPGTSIPTSAGTAKEPTIFP